MAALERIQESRLLECYFFIAKMISLYLLQSRTEMIFAHFLIEVLHTYVIHKECGHPTYPQIFRRGPRMNRHDFHD
jgi:hypothetical protein